jgi:hybrid polyketide synthase/nonribosomal peptide synthetase ACE1
MVLQDTVFPELTIDSLEKVIKPKVDGSVYLDQIFDHQTLEFFVFFSSVAYLAGNAGQSAYSAANAFMASLAARRRSRGLAASIIHLGAVVGVGYVTRELTPEKQQALHQAGYLFLSEQDFLEVFAEGVLASRPDHDQGFEVSTGLRLEGSGQNKALKWASNPMFQHLVSTPDEFGAAGAMSQSTTVSVRAQLSNTTTRAQRFEVLKGEVPARHAPVSLADAGQMASSESFEPSCS